MKLYIVRHGETDWNKSNKIQGLSDIELNETGVHQAELAREKLAKVEFDVCISSPLLRAKKTADIIVNGKCPILINDLIKERYYGDYEGKQPNDGKYVRTEYYDYKLNSNKYNIEPIKTLLERSREFVEYLRENYTDETILIVSHGGIMKTLHFEIIGYDEETNFLSLSIENCAIIEYDIGKEKTVWRKL